MLFLPPDEDDGEGRGRSGETEDQQPADVDPQTVAQLLLELRGVAGHARWESQPGVTTVWTGDDEHDHDVVDEQHQLDQQEHQVGHQPGQQLHGGPPDCPEVEEDVGNQEEDEEDDLDDDALVPPGGEEPLRHTGDSQQLCQLQEREDQHDELESPGLPWDQVHVVVDTEAQCDQCDCVTHYLSSCLPPWSSMVTARRKPRGVSVPPDWSIDITQYLHGTLK